MKKTGPRSDLARKHTTTMRRHMHAYAPTMLHAARLAQRALNDDVTCVSYARDDVFSATPEYSVGCTTVRLLAKLMQWT